MGATKVLLQGLDAADLSAQGRLWRASSAGGHETVAHKQASPARSAAHFPQPGSFRFVLIKAKVANQGVGGDCELAKIGNDGLGQLPARPRKSDGYEIKGWKLSQHHHVVLGRVALEVCVRACVRACPAGGEGEKERRWKAWVVSPLGASSEQGTRDFLRRISSLLLNLFTSCMYDVHVHVHVCMYVHM